MGTPITQDSGQLSSAEPSFGARLKQERERRKITLDQISQSTKIGTRFLQALEEDQFDRLPGGIFNKGFVRAYARSIGLDEEQAVADYLAATGANQPSPESTAPPPPLIVPAEPPRQRSAGLPWGTLALLLLLTAFGFAIWGFYSRATSRNQTTESPSETPSKPPISQPSASPQQPSASPTSAPISTTPAPATETASSHGLVVRIKAREDAWVSVSVDGEVTTELTLAANSEKTFRGHDQIVVKAGNIGALDFEFRGKPLPPQGTPGEVKTIAFSGSGWHALSKPGPAPPTEP
ncbi:MAG TPA: RodZ domain-containing protein [Terriglobales bacterium]|nr:RodZ domain-containing protein [Terriglobales bacterium]